MQLIFASNNQHKIIEINKMLEGSGIAITGLHEFPDIPEPPETCDSFRGNAAQKARFVHQFTGGIVLADDSGLEVFALNRRPGIHSKRYSQEGTAEANNNKLLEELQNKIDRSAQFRCVIAIYDGSELQFVEGCCRGSIAKAPQGEKGFGYDPLFIPQEHPNRTMAELSLSEKNAISHRGLAFQTLLEQRERLFPSF